MSIAAGRLNRRLAFDKRPIQADDGRGNVLGAWAEQFRDWGRKDPMRGNEVVQAGRLTAINPAMIVIRRHAATRQITAAWRVRDLESGETFNIRSVVHDDDRQTMTLYCETGGASG